MNAALLMLFALLGAHWFFDYAGQGDFMAKAKNLANPLPGVPWRQVLIAHAGIHGAAVSLITGIWWLGVFEFICHAITDKAKCERLITYEQDQAIHLLCKMLWWVLAIAFAS